MNELSKQANEILLQLAKSGEQLNYRDFAKQLGINQAPVIAQVVALLEYLIQQEVLHNKPIFAALIVQKYGDIPREGFFEKLYELEVTQQVLAGENAKQWHQSELKKIKEWVVKNDI